MDKQNWIYAIGVPTSKLGPVKIGRTTDVEQRLAALRKGGQVIEPEGMDPATLELLYTTEAEPWIERGLHLHFRRYHLCGEWFALNPAVVAREVKMAIAEIHHKMDKKTYRHAAIQQRRATVVDCGQQPRAVTKHPHMQLFNGWIEAGFTEEQALRMVVMMALEDQRSRS